MSEFTNKIFCLEVQGDFACYTRPEMKVERVSYDVITPSAARAIFSAIFWKPAIRWNIKKIEVLKPILWTSVRRNEVASVASTRSSGIFVEVDRQQRAGLFLRDVAYRLHAELEFIRPDRRTRPTWKNHPEDVPVRNPISDLLEDPNERGWAKDENPGKYNAMFERRASKGQCFNQPYLGCREFSCEFRLVSDPLSEALAKPTIADTRDLGFMLYDLDFTDEQDPKPAFFRPTMKNGVIEVPAWDSDEVRK